MEERNDIVIYKSEDGLVKMEAMVDPANETIWANQKAIAALFGVTVPNISYHLGRIFKSDELEADTVVKEILITAQSGARGTSDEKIRYYTRSKNCAGDLQKRPILYTHFGAPPTANVSKEPAKFQFSIEQAPTVLVDYRGLLCLM